MNTNAQPSPAGSPTNAPASPAGSPKTPGPGQPPTPPASGKKPPLMVMGVAGLALLSIAGLLFYFLLSSGGLDAEKQRLEGLGFECETTSVIKSDRFGWNDPDDEETFETIKNDPASNLPIIECKDDERTHGIKSVLVIKEKDAHQVFKLGVDTATQAACKRLDGLTPEQQEGYRPFLEDRLKELGGTETDGTVLVNGLLYMVADWEHEDLQEMLDKEGISYETPNTPDLSVSLESAC